MTKRLFGKFLIRLISFGMTLMLPLALFEFNTAMHVYIIGLSLFMATVCLWLMSGVSAEIDNEG